MTESKSIVHYVTPKRTHTRHLLDNQGVAERRAVILLIYRGVTQCDTHVAPLGL